MAWNRSILAAAGLGLGLIAITAAMGSGIGSRLGWWHFRTGFAILKFAAYTGIAGASLSLAGAVLTRPGSGHGGFVAALAGIVLGALAFGVPFNWALTAKKVPKIHDISTDTGNPPAFVAVLELRKHAPNPAEYGGPEVAEKQRAAYPDIRPIEVAIPPAKAYDYAMDAGRKMGWRIVDENRDQGRIEATATTRWYGFKDDIVVRIAPMNGNGSKLDIRSVSRVGISDAGANACRIREFRTKFIDLSKAAA